MGDRGGMFNERRNGKSHGRSNRTPASGRSVDRDRNRPSGQQIRRPIPLRPVNHANEMQFYEDDDDFYSARPPRARTQYLAAQNDMPGLEGNQFNVRPREAYVEQPRPACGAACCAGDVYAAGPACGAAGVCCAGPACGEAAACCAGAACGEAAAYGAGPAYGEAAAYGERAQGGAAAAEAGAGEYGAMAAEAGAGEYGAMAAEAGAGEYGAMAAEAGAVGGEAGAGEGAGARAPPHYGGNYARQIRFPTNAIAVVAILPPPPHRICIRCHVILRNNNLPINICEACNMIPVQHNGNPVRGHHRVRGQHRDHHPVRERNREPSPENHGILRMGDVVIPPRGQEFYPPRYYQNRVIVYGEPCFCPMPNLMIDHGINYEMPPPDVVLRRCVHNMLAALCSSCVPGCFVRPF